MLIYRSHLLVQDCDSEGSCERVLTWGEFKVPYWFTWVAFRQPTPAMHLPMQSFTDPSPHPAALPVPPRPSRRPR